MLFQNLSYSPRDFVDRILVETVNLSPKTKDFLEGKSVKTLGQLLQIAIENSGSTLNKNIQREIREFQNRLRDWMKVEIRGIHFSKNIPPPQRKPRSAEKAILIALLLAEPFFGNRRNVAKAKVTHLPELYKETNYPKKNQFSSFRPLRKQRLVA